MVEELTHYSIVFMPIVFPIRIWDDFFQISSIFPFIDPACQTMIRFSQHQAVDRPTPWQATGKRR